MRQSLAVKMVMRDKDHRRGFPPDMYLDGAIAELTYWLKVVDRVNRQPPRPAGYRSSGVVE
jgi:hypothetical protein